VRVQQESGAILERGEIATGSSAPNSASAHTVLVLPGSEAQLRSLDLPTASEAQGRAAAALLFEGSLAADAEDGLYAIAEEGQLGRRRLVAAMGRRRLQQWLDRCGAVGFSPGTILLDCTIWPTPAGHVQIVEVGDRTIVAGGEIGGFSIESDLAPPLVTAWITQAKDIKAVRLTGRNAHGLARQLGPIASVIHDAGAADPTEVIARAAAKPPPYAPNLRQRDLKDVERARAPLRSWGLAISLAVAAVLLQVGVLVFDGWRDRQAARTVLSASETEFRQLRPDVQRIANLRAQVTAALNASRPAAVNPILSASPPVTAVLATHPDVRLEEMRTEAPGRDVMMRFSGPAPAVLDAAVADLRKVDGALKVGQMETSEGRVMLAVSMVAP
jgi:type II secretion system protein L